MLELINDYLEQMTDEQLRTLLIFIQNMMPS